jgi:Tfp pilus assembly protein PilN
VITINLLPVADMRRRLKTRAFLIGYGLTLVLAAAAMFGVKGLVLDQSLKKLAIEKSRTIAALNETGRQVTEASDVTAAAVARWKQFAAIMELDERRRDQTRLLFEVEELLPATKAWLVGLSHVGGLMSLEGISTDKETVSQFLTSLENAAYIDRSSVTLVRISQDLIINGVKLTKFSINAKTSFPRPAIIDRGLPDFGLPSRDDFVKAVLAVDEKLAAELADGDSSAPAANGL